MPRDLTLGQIKEAVDKAYRQHGPNMFVHLRATNRPAFLLGLALIQTSTHDIELSLNVVWTKEDTHG